MPDSQVTQFLIKACASDVLIHGYNNMVLLVIQISLIIANLDI